MCAGAKHDSLELKTTDLVRRLEKDYLLIGSYIVGDEAYIFTDFLLTPVSS